MKINATVLRVTLAAMLLFGTASPLWASRIPDIISGTVSAVVGHDITVDGVTYHVKHGSATDSALLQVRQGSNVQLILNAAPSDNKAQVIQISVSPSTPE